MMTTPSRNGDGRPHLAANHLDDLRKSGLTDDTIRAAALRTIDDPAEVGRLLCWRGPARDLGPCLAFPFAAADGSPRPFVRLKPSTPREREGKPVKYESPIGKGNLAYFPPGTRAALADPSRRLLLTEGEKKALAADQAGIPCIGLVGVYGWQKKRPKGADGKPKGDRELIADLDAVAWQGRTVVIVYDSDAASNPKVLWAEWHLAQALDGRGATVKVVRLPAGPPGEDGAAAKVGLDDSLVANGADALRRLIADAEPAAPPEDGRRKVILGVEEHLSIRDAVRALAENDPGLYQRGGELVRVVRPSGPPRAKRFRPSDCLRIQAVPEADLRTRLTRAAICVVVETVKEKKVLKRTHPTGWLVEGVAALGAWEGVRHLEAVVEAPVLRPDGTVLDRPGYDSDTGLLYVPSMQYPPCPARPTRDDAVRAVRALLDAVCDFPFASDIYRAA